MGVGEFLQNVPGVVWGVVGTAIGVAGTLGGTYLSNKSNDGRFDKQLLHDGQQKAKDRAAELRRPVYLNASDELIAFNGYIGELAGKDATDRAGLTSGLIRFMTAMARVALVADETSRKKVAELTGAYGPMFFECMAEASTAHNLQSSISANRLSYRRLSKEQARLIAAMRDANQNKDSKVIFKSVWDSSESVKKQLVDIAAEFDELTDRQTDALIAYGRAIIPKLEAVLPIQAEVSALLRSELDLTVDLEQMRKEFKATQNAVNSSAEMFYRKLDEVRQENNDN